MYVPAILNMIFRRSELLMANRPMSTSTIPTMIFHRIKMLMPKRLVAIFARLDIPLGIDRLEQDMVIVQAIPQKDN
jgi:hypothetical protein